MDPLLERLQTDPAALGPLAQRRPRRASDLRGCYLDAVALEALIQGGDPVMYETFESPVPEVHGHLAFGITVLYPGRVGGEYFMTKGHYHLKRQTAEVYVALRGRGYFVMQTEQGDARALPMDAGSVIYVAPGWAHRSVNTGNEPFVLFYTFPADAGHDYDAIRQHGFPLRVMDVGGGAAVVERRSPMGGG